MKGSYRADQFGFLRVPYGHNWWKSHTRRAVTARKAKGVRGRKRAGR